MKGGRFDLGAEEPEEPGMLMTSMIDVIFILLAFFICVSEIKKGTLNVDVPEVPTADGASAADMEPVVVEVSAEDAIFLDGERVDDPGELARRLAEVSERSQGEAPVRLSGDAAARNGTMMRVVSELSRAGLRRVEFVVQAGGE